MKSNNNWKPFLGLIKEKLNASSFANTKLEYKLKKEASVLFLLAPGNNGNENGKNNSDLILCKRSEIISQPGDLCCPGGKLSPKIDSFIAKILMLPGTPLTQWPYWEAVKQNQCNKFVTHLATAFRESFEEIRINPLGMKLLGALPPQDLYITKTTIYPFVCWVPEQKKFYLNSEVDKIVRIPLSLLFLKKNYFNYRIKGLYTNEGNLANFPCFAHYQNGTREILWGVTYRITATFLKIIFDYSLSNPITARC